VIREGMVCRIRPATIDDYEPICALFAEGDAFHAEAEPAEIVNGVAADEAIGQTALCPSCGIDAVIGAACGYPITVSFLARMHSEWFR
jgi:hypothetical protein